MKNLLTSWVALSSKDGLIHEFVYGNNADFQGRWTLRPAFVKIWVEMSLNVLCDMCQNVGKYPEMSFGIVVKMWKNIPKRPLGYVSKCGKISQNVLWDTCQNVEKYPETSFGLCVKMWENIPKRPLGYVSKCGKIVLLLSTCVSIVSIADHGMCCADRSTVLWSVLMYSLFISETNPHCILHERKAHT